VKTNRCLSNAELQPEVEELTRAAPQALRAMRSMRLRMIVSTVVALALVGCTPRNPILSSGPSPRVEDCVQIQQATPTKYVCGGKLYTSVQLAAIRNGQQVQ